MTAPSAQPPPPQPSAIGLQAGGGDGHLVVTVSGDLDHASHLRLLDDVSALIAAGSARLVIDLAEVGFCDSTGLGALVRLHRQAQAQDGWLRLARARADLRRMLELTNLIRLLPLYETVPDAVADVRRLADRTPGGNGSAG